jgi:Protein of unknown function (DUF3788)
VSAAPPSTAGATSTRAAGRPPSDVQLRRLLGPALPAWDALVQGGEARHHEWKRYGARTDWVLRVYEGKRTVLWARPVPGALHATVIVGAKAVVAGLAGGLPERLKKRLRASPAYPEGRAVRFRLRSAAGVGDVERLVALKLGR